MPPKKQQYNKQMVLSAESKGVPAVCSYLDNLNHPESLAKVNALTVLKQFNAEVRAEDLVIAFRSLFTSKEYPMEITYNILRTDIRSNTEFLYKRHLITDPGNPEPTLNLCSSLRGKENLFGLTNGDRNLELYNSSRLVKHIVYVRDVAQITESLVVDSSHRTRLEGHHLENNPDNFAESRYIEYAFPVESLGARTVTTTNKADGKRTILAVEYENRIFIREYFDQVNPGWRHVTCGLFVLLNESGKVNHSRMQIIKGLVDQLDHLC